MYKKINEISSYEVLMCIFVIIAHSMSECVLNLPKDSIMYLVFFYFSRSISVAVSAFILSAGIKFMNKYKNIKFSYIDFITDRIYKIIIPYIFVVCLYYLYFIYRGQITDFNFSELLKYIFSGNLAAPFYFVIVIMQFYILSPIWIIFCKKIHVTFGMIIAIIITFLSHYLFKNSDYNNRMFLYYLLYWMTGCYIGLNFDKNINYLHKIKKPLIVIGILFTFTYMTFAYMLSVNKNTILSNEAVEMTRIIFCLFAAIMYLLIIKRNNNKIIHAMSYCTYYVYLIHSLIIFETDNVMTQFEINSLEQRFIIRLLITFILSFVLSFLYVYPKKLFHKK